MFEWVNLNYYLSKFLLYYWFDLRKDKHVQMFMKICKILIRVTKHCRKQLQVASIKRKPYCKHCMTVVHASKFCQIERTGQWSTQFIQWVHSVLAAWLNLCLCKYILAKLTLGEIAYIGVFVIAKSNVLLVQSDKI